MSRRNKKTIQQLAYETVTEAIEDPAGKHILEVGAGTGELSQRLAEEGALVTALDLKKPELLTNESATFSRHDLTDGSLPFEDQSFDCVVSTELIEHMRAPFLLLTSMVRVMAPGGVLVLTMPNYWNLKYRLRYLFTGNMPMPVLGQPGSKKRYQAGYAPHINVLTYSTLRSILTWEGCDHFQVRTARLFSWRRRVGYMPVFLLVKLCSVLAGRRNRERLFLAQTGSASVLFGRRHVLLSCRRN